MKTKFTKMHGIGNDFVMIDARSSPLSLSSPQARFIADRHFGVGCDQIIVICLSHQADIALVIYNADGSTAKACGNGTRCVADLILDKNDTRPLTIETVGGDLLAWRDGEMIAVDMGEPILDYYKPQIAQCGDILKSMLVNIGNLHAVHFVSDLSSIDLAELGSKLEYNFSGRANIEFVCLESDNRLRVKVWERGKISHCNSFKFLLVSIHMGPWPSG